MFNKYWREYPIWMQLLLLILMVFTMFSAATVLSLLLVPMLTGVSTAEVVSIDVNSPHKTVFAFKIFQMISNLALFGGTAFLFAYTSHPEPVTYLGFRKVKRPMLVVVSLLLLVASLPIVLQLGQWMRELNFAAANESQERSDTIMKALMQDKTVGDLLFTVFVLAVIPAFGEELFFRGVIMRFFHKQTKNISFAIFMSAGLFALFHGQLYNLPSIFIMGMVLGYVYYYTGRIWANIIVHFTNNALQIVVEYMAKNGIIPDSVTENDSFPWYVLVIGTSAAVLFFMLLKKPATPLPAGWSSDFTVEELEEKLKELNNRQ
ncbi:MAG: CPBP family intramembrane metalloprotease [Chitinophagaceae bacterium]|nr:CPBP family intramembrane metalloprotease [Chitinophagaceae bacterium]